MCLFDCFTPFVNCSTVNNFPAPFRCMYILQVCLISCGPLHLNSAEWCYVERASVIISTQTEVWVLSKNSPLMPPALALLCSVLQQSGTVSVLILGLWTLPRTVWFWDSLHPRERLDTGNYDLAALGSSAKGSVLCSKGGFLCYSRAPVDAFTFSAASVILLSLLLSLINFDVVHQRPRPPYGF